MCSLHPTAILSLSCDRYLWKVRLGVFLPIMHKDNECRERRMGRSVAERHGGLCEKWGEEVGNWNPSGRWGETGASHLQRPLPHLPPRPQSQRSSCPIRLPVISPYLGHCVPSSRLALWLL